MIAVHPVTLISQLKNRMSVFICLVVQKSLFMNLKMNNIETYQPVLL